MGFVSAGSVRHRGSDSLRVRETWPFALRDDVNAKIIVH